MKIKKYIIVIILILLILLGIIIYHKSLINITIPPELAEGITEEYLNRDIKEHIYIKATLNKDKSVTYVMNKKQYQKILYDLKIIYDDSIDEMIDEEDGILMINRSDDFSDFEIVLASSKLPNSQNLINYNLIYMAKMYNCYNKSQKKYATISYYDNYSKEIILEENIKIK